MSNINISEFKSDGSIVNLILGNESQSSNSSNANCSIDDFSIYWKSTEKVNSLMVNGASFKKLTFSGQTNTSNFLIKNILIAYNLCLKNINCTGKIKFHNVKFNRQAYFRIEDSDLGKSEFINVHFDSLFQIEVVDSKISNIELTKCSAPSRVIGEGTNDHNGARDAIKQFKQAFAKSNDKIQEMYLVPLEYDEHLKSLKWEWKCKWRDIENNANIIVLNLNRSSNFHGQGVGRSLVITFVFSIASYSIYCLLLGILPGWDSEQTGKVMSFLLEYVNPLHKPEYLTDNLIGENKYVSNYARAWEGFSKLMIAYLIYQFIQSFRKFGK